MCREIIRMDNVSKIIKGKEILKDISFSLNKGELGAIIGRNGAGKSTILDIASNILTSDSGSVVYDFETNKKGSIGVVYQDSILDKNLTSMENLYFRAGMYGYKKKEAKKRVEEVSHKLNCKPFLEKKYGELSGGQKRRIDIARSLLSKPEFLILDEPTTGLDVESRNSLWDSLKTLRMEENLTILMTTHYLEETEISDKIIVLEKGQIISHTTPTEIKEKYCGKSIEEAIVNIWMSKEELNCST